MTNLLDRLRTLFPEPERKPVDGAALLWCTLAVVIGAAVSLGRTAGPGPFDTLAGEDAQPLLNDALNQNALRNIITPFVGYFQLAARLLAELPVLFPISWAAAVMSISSAIVCALLALTVYVAAAAHFPSRMARLMVSAPLLFSATAENWVSENHNRPATIHFFLVYTLLWLLLWRPASRSGRVTQVVLVVVTGLSTIVAVVFIPLALLRLWVLRDRLSLAMAAALAAAGVTQWAGLHFGLTSRPWSIARYEPLWAAQQLVSWAVPHSVLGWNFMFVAPGDPAFTIEALWRASVAWLLVLAIVVCAFRRLTSPQWLLAAVAAVQACLYITMAISANGIVTQRYLMTFQMMLFTALVALLLPSDRLSARVAKLPIVAFAVLVVAIGAVNYRHNMTYRHIGPRWAEQIAGARQACANPRTKTAIVRAAPPPYTTVVKVPCHLLQVATFPCPDPYCVTVDPGVAEVYLDGSRP
jgi:hypothetical protein